MKKRENFVEKNAVFFREKKVKKFQDRAFKALKAAFYWRKRNTNVSFFN